MVCSACGSAVNAGAKFCSNCGTVVQPQPYAGATPPVARELVRPRVGRKVAGVCLGIAQYCGWDVTLVRLVALVSAICFALPFIAYLVAWVVMPDAPYELPAGYAAPPASGSQGPGATV